MRLAGKKYLLLGCFLCLILGLPSQNPLIDSLKSELANHPKNDSTKVNILNDLAFEFHRVDMNRTLSYLEKSEEILATIDYPKGKARGLYVRGVLHYMKSDYDLATSYVRNAIQVYDTPIHKNEFAKCYNVLGIIASAQGKYRESITLYNESIRIKEAIGEKISTSNTLLNIGSVYADMGNYPESILHYEKALAIYSESNDQHGISKCLNNLGTVYDEQGNSPLALEYFYKSLTLYRETNDSLGISKSLNNIGSIYKMQGNYDKALIKYGESLAILQRNNNKSHIIRLKINIGNVYMKKLAFQTALQYYEEASKLSQEVGDQDNASTSLNCIGDVYLSLNEPSVARTNYEKAEVINLEINDQHSLSNSYLGIAETYLAEKNYQKALDNTLKSKRISYKLKIPIHQRLVQSLLFRIYKATGEFEKALQSHENFQALKDSLFNAKNIEKMAQLEYEYKYKAELESANNRERKLSKTVYSTTQDLEKSQRNALIAIIAILLISLVSGSIIFYQKLKNAQAINQNILIEQKLLRSQMTPHFIFNSLSVLQGMILNKESENSISYLSKFSRLLRTVLENSRHKTVSLDKELLAIKSYMDLQNLSVRLPIDFQLNLDPTITNMGFKIPPMLIQPFIENAVEHAFRNNESDKKIEIGLTFEDQKLVCTISDNGVGLKAEQGKQRKDKKSLATTITSERLAILSKYFEVQGTVHIQDREVFGEQGTLVTLVIPYKIETV